MAGSALVFGATGQVGRALAELVATRADHARFCFLGRDCVDLADQAAVRAAIAERRPILVINAAAYTNVDLAESERAAVFAVNRDGPAAMAEGCAAVNAALLHISTDYVFDGCRTAPYREEDSVAPLGVYGESKAAGEAAVHARLGAHVILRTAWVFSPYGRNFVKTMLRLGAERSELAVVDDQRGGPTAAHDIARTLLIIGDALAAGRARAFGTFHFCGAPAITWYGFATALFEIARPRLARVPQLRAIATADYPTRARRPANSVLDCRRLAEAYGIEQPDWRVALQSVVAELLGGNNKGEQPS